MKNLTVAALLAVFAFPALAGSLAPVEVEPELIVVEKESASSVSPLLVVGLLVVIGAIISQQED